MYTSLNVIICDTYEINNKHSNYIYRSVLHKCVNYSNCLT